VTSREQGERHAPADAARRSVTIETGPGPRWGFSNSFIDAVLYRARTDIPWRDLIHCC
jgi:hypothetical protein